VQPDKGNHYTNLNIYGNATGKMEEKKLKEIEAKLNQLLKENSKSRQPETKTTQKSFHGVEVIRRRKGQRDLHIA